MDLIGNAKSNDECHTQTGGSQPHCMSFPTLAKGRAIGVHSHGTKEIFNLPLLVLKARHLSGSAFYTGFSRLEVPEQALDGIHLGLGLVVKINLLNFHACV